MESPRRREKAANAVPPPSAQAHSPGEPVLPSSTPALRADARERCETGPVRLPAGIADATKFHKSNGSGSFRSIRLALKRIIFVRPPPAKQLNRRCREIRRNEQRPPALGLADMHTLMSARRLQQKAVASKHDMAYRHRRSAALPW